MVVNLVNIFKGQSAEQNERWAQQEGYGRKRDDMYIAGYWAAVNESDYRPTMDKPDCDVWMMGFDDAKGDMNENH